MTTKITSLPAISSINASVDPIPIVDVSDTTQASSGTTKRVTISQIASSIYAANPSISSGLFADPNGNVAAVPGSIYFDLTTPAAPVQWVKTTGTGNTGWI